MHVVESVCASEQPAGGFYRLKDVHSAERRRRALRLAKDTEVLDYPAVANGTLFIKKVVYCVLVGMCKRNH